MGRRKILVTLDGAPLFGGPITDNSLATGTVGLYSWSSEGVAFDEIRVTSLDPTPSLALAQPTVPAPGFFGFAITGPGGPRYRIETSTNLTDWTALTNIPAVLGTLDFTNSLPPGLPVRRFFRVVIP